MTSSDHTLPLQKKQLHLGDLSLELLDAILSEVATLDDLKNLVFSGRFIYRHFKSQQRRILLQMLQHELGPVFYDALFLDMLPYMQPPDDPRAAYDYLNHLQFMGELYRNLLDERLAAPLLSIEELNRLCKTLRVMTLFTDLYLEAKLSMFGTRTMASQPATSTERLRIMRAVYRRQIICNAWVPTERQPRWTVLDLAAISNTREQGGWGLGLLAGLQPWEMQQVDHVEHFISQLCLTLDVLVDEDASKGSSSVALISEAQFGELYARLDCLESFIRPRNGRLHDVLRFIKALPPLGSRRLVAERPTYSTYLRRYRVVCFSYSWQASRMNKLPDPTRDPPPQQDGGEGSEQDGISGEESATKPMARIAYTVDAIDLPPFGWVDAVNERYVNWFGDALSCPPLHVLDKTGQDEADFLRLQRIGESWSASGLTFWDRARVNAINALDLDWLHGVCTGRVVC